MSFQDAFITTVVSFFSAVLKIFSPIIIVILLWIFIKMIYRYKKYGKKYFSTFKKYEMVKISDIIKSEVKKIENDVLFVENKFYYCDLIIISKSGIYLIKTNNYDGIITGKRNDKTLNNTVKVDLIKQIENPFYNLDVDKKDISLRLNISIIKCILVTNNNVNININDVIKDEIISVQNLYYKMEKLLKKEVLSKTEMLEIYSRLNEVENEKMG